MIADKHHLPCCPRSPPSDEEGVFSWAEKLFSFSFTLQCFHANVWELENWIYGKFSWFLWEEGKAVLIEAHLFWIKLENGGCRDPFPVPKVPFSVFCGHHAGWNANSMALTPDPRRLESLTSALGDLTNREAVGSKPR